VHVQKFSVLLNRPLLKQVNMLIVIEGKEEDNTRLWIVRINAEARNNGLSYSQLINGLKKANIEIDRKVLSDIAIFDKPAFAKIAEQAKAALN